ncbi:PIG-L family deacetylase [Phenylobacterium sp. LjRoot164]|uniref:PIG-L deacetylase family protein n=1 Tax=unclassified Phenylobacterium TaxID=2640670 RepID=UPI003ED0B49F
MIWLLPALAAAKGGATFWLARKQLNDDGVSVARDLFADGAPRRVMAIWAHPDDEITCAGALAGMARDGAELILVYLTAGEAAKDTGYTREELTRVRRAEAQAAGEHLGAAGVEVLDFPDGGLTISDPAVARAAIAGLIERFAPSLVISFDEKVGFYGHPDHIQTGRWVREVIEAGAPSVRRLYQATLPRPMVALALKLVSAFRDNYPKAPEDGLPAPTVAVNIVAYGRRKRRLLDIHASQAKVIADVQPYADRVPHWLYYRLFDREYFALAIDR